MRDSKRKRSTWTDTEHWKFSVEKRGYSERALDLTLRFAFWVYAKRKSGKRLFDIEASYPELVTLAEFGFSREMITAAHKRALRGSEILPLVLIALIVVFFPTMSAINIFILLLSSNDTIATWVSFVAVAPIFCFVFTIGSAWTEQDTGDEARVFDAVIGTMATLHNLRKVCLLQFSASLSGKRQIIRMRKNGRKHLRANARVCLIYCPKLVGLSSSDEEYFKCVRIVAWILHSAKNFRSVEALNKSYRACGDMIEHLLRGRPWEIADVAPAPEDVDILPPSFRDRIKDYLLNIVRPVNLSLGLGIVGAVVTIFRK